MRESVIMQSLTETRLKHFHVGKQTTVWTLTLALQEWTKHLDGWGVWLQPFGAKRVSVSHSKPKRLSNLDLIRPVVGWCWTEYNQKAATLTQQNFSTETQPSREKNNGSPKERSVTWTTPVVEDGNCCIKPADWFGCLFLKTEVYLHAFTNTCRDLHWFLFVFEMLSGVITVIGALGGHFLQDRIVIVMTHCSSLLLSEDDQIACTVFPTASPIPQQIPPS